MAPPLTGKSLILHPRILPNGAGADTIGAVIAKCPSVAPRGLGRRTKEATMTTKLVALVLLCLMTGTAMAQQPKVTSLMSKDLTENPGREALMITVEYAPGGSDPIHRHNAHAIVYVLEGSVVMQVKGGKQVTLTPGQTFYEGPDDVHVVGRNASSTKPAKFLVFLIKDKGAPVLVPVE
jgi:quercetin dioxygenase-like cupin family protein